MGFIFWQTMLSSELFWDVSRESQTALDSTVLMLGLMIDNFL